MDKLIEWIKANVKDGADLNEVQQLVAGVTEVTPERAAELARDKEVRRIIDAEISRAVERHDEKFREEKLPKMLDEERSKIRAELNPEETPEQKRIRELEEWKANAEREREYIARKDALRKKAGELGISELGLSPDDFEPFAQLGDQAESMLASFVERTKDAWTKSLDQKIKERYKGATPSAGSSPASGTDRERLMQEYQTHMANGDMQRANMAYLAARKIDQEE